MSKQLPLTRIAAALVGGCLLAGCHSSSTGSSSTGSAKTTAPATGTTTVGASAAPAQSAAATSAATSATTSAGAATSAGSSAAAASPAPSTQPAAAQGKLNGVPQACPSAAEVISHLNISGLVLDGSDPALCQYLHNGDKTAPFAVITFNAAPPGFTPAAFHASLESAQTGVAAVPNLGDAAFSWNASPGAGLSFLSGGTICSIFTVVPTTTANEVSLAKALFGS